MRLGLLVLFASIAAAAPDPPRAGETITVTATGVERRVADTPVSTIVVDAGSLEASVSPAVDDALRSVAGFTLFRRAGSRVANPTTQGASLRGIGASGASRVLVLEDGMPVNDPFGTWVPWTRLPRIAYDRIEVVRGGGAELYGSSAFGGVIQLVRDPDPDLATDLLAGSRESWNASSTGGIGRGAWTGVILADAAGSEGYIPLVKAFRGPVDVPANESHVMADVTIRRTADLGNAFFRAGGWSSERGNGTRLQWNETESLTLAAGGDGVFAGTSLRGRAWWTDQDYAQSFTAVDAARAVERIVRQQSVPSQSVGGSIQVSRPFGDAHLLVAGGDAQEVEGRSDETVFGRLESNGGTQRRTGVWIEDLWQLRTDLLLTAGVRFDHWSNEEGGGAVRSDDAVSPRLSLLYRRSSRLAFAASAYRAFRTPSLNELYRPFRVGDVLTLANAALEAERLQGMEAGAIVSSRRVDARLTLFSMNVEDNVANVTLSAGPELTTRQRRNLGETRSQGVELDLSGRWAAGGRWSASALLVDTEVVSGGGLEGNELPQIPRAQLTLLLEAPEIATLRPYGQLRWSAAAWEDDLNRVELPSWTTLDLGVSRAFGAIVLHAAVENVLAEDVIAARTPLPSITSPRHVIVRLRYAR